MTPIRVLLSHCIDYAGMFPPSGLDLETAVANYAAYRDGPDCWALGNLVLPSGALGAFSDRWPHYAAAWPVTAVVRGDLKDKQNIAGLDRARGSLAAVECGPFPAAEISRAANPASDSALLYIEAGATADPAEAIAAIAAIGARPKLRTGGLTPASIPSVEQVTRFLQCCTGHHVPFKATAGLHHALRGTHALTTEPASAEAPMHGFLNLLLASALLAHGAETATAAAVLYEQDAAAFRVTGAGITWRDCTLTPEQLRRSRAQAMVSFGSCAFVEPLQELRALGWIG